MGSKHDAPAGTHLQHRRRHSSELDGEAATQPTGLFSSSHHFQINDSQLNDFSQSVHYHDDRKKKSYLKYLQRYIAEGALHDSMARFPPPKCHPQTREKVLKIIMDWVKNPRVRQGIIWLNGPAGAGKSAIAQTIAGRCADQQLAASFFFLRNSSDRGTAARLFTTLAWQLAKNIPELLSYIESAAEADPLFSTKSLDIQFDNLIVQPFQELLHDKPDFCSQRSLVIIDGVDECSPDRDQLLCLRLIGNALSKMHIPLRFLICSRPEAHIQEGFKSGVMADVTRPLLLNDQFNPDDDIRRYLEDEFTRISAEHNLLSSRWPSRSAIEQLVFKSSGQFIYASTVTKFVDDIYDDPKERLGIVLKTRPANSSSPFAELDQLYIQILSQQPDTKLLRNLFTLIIALREPDTDFVCRRLRIGEQQLRRKLLRLRSLVNMSDWNITTYHLSLHDFFLDRKRAGKYFIHPIRITFIHLPNVMRKVFRSVAAFVAMYGMESLYFTPERAFLVPGIVFLYLIETVVMSYSVFVDPVPTYTLLVFPLHFLAWCTRQMFPPRTYFDLQAYLKMKIFVAVLCFVVLVPHFLAVYHLFWR